MSVYQTILNQYNEVRKQPVGNTWIKELLAPLIGDAQTIAKRGKGGDLGDADMFKLIKQHIDGLDTTEAAIREQFKNDGGMVIMHTDMIRRQRDLLRSYMPVMMSPDLIMIKISHEFDGQENVKLGNIMTFLKKNFEGQYDGKIASQLANTYLSNK